MFPITTIYAALAGLFLFYLSLRVSLGRDKHKLSLGDGGEKDMIKRVRQQGNFTEYAPMTLILMALAEAQGAPAGVLHAIGIALVLSRLGHFFGMLGGKLYPLRLWGMMATYALLAALSVGLLGHAML